MPLAVPTIPMSSLGHDLEAGPFPDMAGALRSVTPVQSGSISRIGSSIYAMAPDPVYTMAPDPAGAPPETDLETAWGFMAGEAPPGSSALTVAANGTTFIRGNCYAHSGGFAGSYGGIDVLVDEFVPVAPPEPEEVVSLSSTTHDYETVAEIGPGPSARRSPPPPPPLRPPETASLRPGLAWTQRFASARTLVLSLETSLLEYQVSALDTQPTATTLVTPITPGRSYLWWIDCYQYVGVATPGSAVSNISFDFGPVFFAFT